MLICTYTYELDADRAEQRGGTGRSIPGACFVLRRRWTALHRASEQGHTEMAMVLVAAGGVGVVHCKDKHGCGSGFHLRVMTGCWRARQS